MEPVLVRFGIPLMALALSALFVVAVWFVERGSPPSLRRRRTLLAFDSVALWLAVVATLALSGALSRFDLVPPPMMAWFVATLVLPLAVALSPLGHKLALRLPFAALVGFQAFRLPLELVMHRAASEGIMPRVMSYSG